LAELAREIFEHFRNIAPHKNQIHVYLPSGTGTTAHFLHRNLLLLSENTGIQPYTVGVSIAMTPQNLLASVQRSHPAEPGYPIFAHPSQGRIRFAEPNARVKSMWCFMKRKGIDLDLIYGPVAWMLLFEQLPSIDHSKAEVYYVHTGGLTGNASQLKRYPKDQCKVLKQL
jgi:1-aminocyclopropane-1-carboxylate deaminase